MHCRPSFRRQLHFMKQTLKNMSSELAQIEPPQVRESNFYFDRIGVARFVLNEVALQPVEEGKSRSDYKQVTIQFGAGISLLANGKADFRMQLRVVTDPRSKPYEIELELVGTFSTQSGDSDALLAFCQSSAAPIMFPYARQIVNEVTSNGRFGPVRLALMNFHGVLAGGIWEQDGQASALKSEKAKPRKGVRKAKSSTAPSRRP